MDKTQVLNNLDSLLLKGILTTVSRMIIVKSVVILKNQSLTYFCATRKRMENSSLNKDITNVFMNRYM